MQRRDFLRTASAAGCGLIALKSWGEQAASAGAPILLRSGWGAGNIGDVGHTPGAIDLVMKYCPGRRIILWPRGDALSQGVGEFLKASFPDLRFAEGKAKDGKPDTPELAKAWDEAGFLLHSSGSGFTARGDVEAWHKTTGKPYGVFPVSTDPILNVVPGKSPEGATLAELRVQALALPVGSAPAELVDVVDHADFMFTRDTTSLEYLRRQGLHAPVLEMGPDTQFGMTQRDTAWGDGYMREHGLVEHKFICVIPRTRYTMDITANSKSEAASQVNASHLQHDMDLLKDVMERYIRATGNKVFICPEMTYQISLGKKYLYDPFPADLKDKLVWKSEFWNPAQAAAVYAKASAVLSVECHSPIISLVQRTPAFYIRQPTDTCKGQMYPDLGLSDWTFEIDHTSGAELWSRLQGILAHPAAARAKAAKAMDLVRVKQDVMGKALRESLARMDRERSPRT